MARWLLVISLLAYPASGFAQVVSFEVDSAFPEAANPPWTRIGTFDADRWLDDGWFYQFVELGAWAPPPGGEQDFYKRGIAEFSGSSAFFVEWNIQTTAPSSKLDVSATPVVVSVSGSGAALYHFTITDARVQFVRDNPIGLVLLVDIDPQVPHRYLLRITDQISYEWYLDGELICSGESLGPYPTSNSKVTWGAAFHESEHTTKWKYVRYGVIPADASGDFDSDGDVDGTDAYFFVDCLLGPDYDAAGPGCEWADMNADGVANGKDIALFVDAMLAA